MMVLILITYAIGTIIVLNAAITGNRLSSLSNPAIVVAGFAHETFVVWSYCQCCQLSSLLSLSVIAIALAFAMLFGR